VPRDTCFSRESMLVQISWAVFQAADLLTKLVLPHASGTSNNCCIILYASSPLQAQERAELIERGRVRGSRVIQAASNSFLHFSPFFSCWGLYPGAIKGSSGQLGQTHSVTTSVASVNCTHSSSSDLNASVEMDDFEQNTI
jgi:hypothetical protein